MANSLAKDLKDNFEAVEKLRERVKEIQRLLGVENITLTEEMRLAEELTKVFGAIRRVESHRDELYAPPPPTTT
jgi:wobble nucleotide-excising tRNase